MSERVPEPPAALVGAAAPGALEDGALVRLLAEVEALGRQVDAARVRLAAEAAHRSRRELGPERLAARLGCRNASELVQRTTGVAGSTAGRRIRLGAATRGDVGLTGAAVDARFAAVAEALADGSLGVDAAHAIVTALDPTLRVAHPADVARGERELVDAAVATWSAPLPGEARPGGDQGGPVDGEQDDERDGGGADEAGDGSSDEHARGRSWSCPRHDADDVRLQARVWAEFLDPDGVAPSERDEERRFLTLRAARGGLVPVSGLLLPQVAAALRTYADAWTNPKTDPVPDPTVPAAGASSTAGSAPTEGASRSAGASLAAGTSPTEGASRATGASSTAGTDPAETRSRAQVLHDVLATAVAVAARAADAPSVAGNAPTLVVVAREDGLHTTGGAARTGDGTPVSMAAARHVGCAGAIQRIGVDRTGRVVGLWSAQRCFTGAQRRAIAVRDGGCVIPGCHVPAGWCEVHHVRPYAEDPDGTHVDNGVLLCWHHHRTIDTSGWDVRMTGGMPWVRPPGWLDRSRRWRPARPPGRRDAA